MSKNTAPPTDAPDSPPPAAPPRRRGRKPADASERRAQVVAALADLTSSRTPFSMGDLAERAGISRATLYRDAALRDLVGTTGDGPAVRPVTFSDYEDQKRERDRLAADRRTLKKTVREQGETITGLLREIDKLERSRNAFAEAARGAQHSADADAARKEAYAEGFSQGVRTAMGQRGNAPGATGARRPVMPGAAVPGGLTGAAAKLPRAQLQTARRNLARVLHPDLFAGDDPATAALATELLKQINALAVPDEKRAP